MEPGSKRIKLDNAIVGDATSYEPSVGALIEVSPISATSSFVSGFSNVWPQRSLSKSNDADSLANESGKKSRPTVSCSCQISDRTGIAICDLPRIKLYIPAGCIKVERSKTHISRTAWSACRKLHAFRLPIDVPVEGPILLPEHIQDLLLASKCLSPFKSLFKSRWIKLEFQTLNPDWGQIRIYVLPDDVGRKTINREGSANRKVLQQLLGLVDAQPLVWNNQWEPEVPYIAVDTSPLDTDLNEDVSLFSLFNTLPSPVPRPEEVKDPYTRRAMYDILNGEVMGLKTELFPYQRRSAAMMLQREGQPSPMIDPRLRQLVDMDGNRWYCDLSVGTVLRSPRMYEAARGGICAESMGLGKTLICLALILATRDSLSSTPIEHSAGRVPVRKRVASLVDMAAANIGRNGTPWKNCFRQTEEDESLYQNCISALRRSAGSYDILPKPRKRRSRNPVVLSTRRMFLSTATLIVVPRNLVRQWESEIGKHTSGLKVLIMNELKSRLPCLKVLLEYDIILFSKSRFELEAKSWDNFGSEAHSTWSDDGDANDQVCRACKTKSDICKDGLPMKHIHFKRLITDEGHTIGNSSAGSKANAVVVVDSLALDARWIVSGTPTQGLYGSDILTNVSRAKESDDVTTKQPNIEFDQIKDVDMYDIAKNDIRDYEQERKDLEKLGNIAKIYLKVRPWSGTSDGADVALWAKYIMQPRHGGSGNGNMACLRDTLRSMIVRHRPEDVEHDITLPPLYQKTVYLEGSYQDKLSINLFSLMITSNAVTSERKDADYLFHPSQRQALGSLVANLRQASFFWSATSPGDVEQTLGFAAAFLDSDKIAVSKDDRKLLQNVINIGNLALSNDIWLATARYHEMPLYVESRLPESISGAWALDKNGKSPTLVGAAQLLILRDHVCKLSSDVLRGSFNQDSTEWSTKLLVLEAEGQATMSTLDENSIPVALEKSSKASKVQRKTDVPLAALAGGLTISTEPSPRKRHGHMSKTSPVKSTIGTATNYIERRNTISIEADEKTLVNRYTQSPSRAPINQDVDMGITSDQGIHESSSNRTKILSCASAKLSYLISEIIEHSVAEKIIIFYEAENVAWYIAQALELLSLEHLIYAKTLSAEVRSRYLAEFNNSEDFRVLLMDISQAAFGLDIVSASRVYFVNPVFNKQIEAQAVKRAHRIGQLRPVYVETLVLKDTMEELVVERRLAMSSDEQMKCKSVLDDQAIYDWIKNIRFVPMPAADIPGHEQMAALKQPRNIFSEEEDVLIGKM